jgi:ubiquinol-cytochrome c reductase subunit 9
MSLVTTLYNNILRRSSTYALAIVAGAFFFERGFDLASEHLYSEINKGVSND